MDPIDESMKSTSSQQPNCTFSLDDEKNLELYALAWLDKDIDSITNRTEKQQKLRTAVNTVIMYHDVNMFKQWMKRREGRDEKVILVTSECTGKEIMPELHNWKQLSAIYIYNSVQDTSEHWSKDCSKVRSVKTTLDEIIEQILKDKVLFRKMEDVNFFSIMNSNAEPGRSSSYLNGDFLWNQKFIEVLLRMEHKTTDLNKLVQLCNQKYNGNPPELKKIEQFAREYSPEKALLWYTYESCFFRILNHALRTQEVSTLIVFRFFIHDLYVQLKQLQADAEHTPISRVYRTQWMSRDELDELKGFIGGFISLNSFLSTSLDSEMASAFTIGAEMKDYGLQPVLFEIDILRSIQNTKPFANISSHSNMSDENEVLFMLGSIFKLCNIVKDDSKWTVTLQLTSESDSDLSHLLAYVKKDIKEEEDFISLGEVLFGMGKFDKAKICFEYKLEELNKTELSPILVPKFANCYDSLGRTAGQLRNYDLAIEYFKKQLELCESGPFHIIGPLIIKAYQNMVQTYIAMQDTANAAIYNEKIEALQKEVSYDDGIHRGETFLHRGFNCFYQNLYDDALNNYHQALLIFEQCLPSDYYHIAMALENIGRVHEKRLEFEIALDYYLRAERIYSHSLTSTHGLVSEVRDHIKYVTYQILRQNVAAYYETADYYANNGQFEDALNYYKEVLLILKERFSSNHYVIGKVLMTIARTYADLAHSHHVRSKTDPDIYICYPKDHENIIEYLSQAKQVFSQNVAPTHPDMLFILGAIELSQRFLSYQTQHNDE